MGAGDGTVLVSDGETNFSVPGAVVISNGDGINTTYFRATQALQLGPMSVTGGINNDDFQLTGPNVTTGVISVINGNGSNYVGLKGGITINGGIAVVGGNAFDKLEGDFEGNLTVNGSIGHDVDWLLALADDASQAAMIRATAMAELGHQIASTAGNKFLLQDAKDEKDRPTQEQLESAVAQLEHYWQNISQPFLTVAKAAAAENAVDSNVLVTGAALGRAHVYRLWRFAEVALQRESILPKTAADFCAAMDSPTQALDVVMDLERHGTTWGPKSLQMLTCANEILGLFIGLTPDLVHRLWEELKGPPDRDDGRFMTLLVVAAEVAAHSPSLIAAPALAHPQFADRLTNAVRRHNTFPGRCAAMSLLSYLTVTLDEQVATAIQATLQESWYVQRGALLLSSKSVDISPKLMDTLIQQLTGESAIAAYTAARILTNYGASPSTPVERVNQVLQSLVAAAAHPRGEREVFHLDEDFDRWCVHHFGRLRDIFYEGILTVTGISSTAINSAASPR